ncbi:hypothetical protein [Zunongwangia pacifica]|uniref:Uncharacterized protein n=1 Tax=Zunongwangia pacifica TaxID=2911062 RepID=A0A9X1ZR14_9FLAO|nr:hypothetical protein [Zunongwangia pacifica]MCL6219432.1 hypothetical protein [Zunongwangia pacifica]
MNLSENGKYTRSIYNSKGKLIYVNSGKWSYTEKSRIDFTKFFIDRDIPYDDTYLVNEEGLINASFPVEFKNLSFAIVVDNSSNYYYQKID